MNKLDGYTEVMLGGELRPIKFGMGAWKLIADERQKPMAELFAGMDEIEFIATITYAGLKFACLAGYTELQPPESIHYVYDWLDEANTETYETIGKCFAESRIMGQTMKDYIANVQAGEAVKKKKPLKK